jgi:hypothetical protein
MDFGLALTIVLLASSPVDAAPPPPPGGHIPIFFGGANQAGYPALTPTDVSGSVSEGVPAELSVTSAPNPFRAQTKIRFALRRADPVMIRLFNLAGEEVKVMSLRPAQTGWQEAVWDGSDRAGKRVSSGVYFYRLETGNLSATGRIVYLK